MPSADSVKVDFAKSCFSKNLDTKILTTEDLGSRLLGSPNRHCLDYDRAELNCGARSDVTMKVWKPGERERLLCVVFTFRKDSGREGLRSEGFAIQPKKV